MLIHFFNKILVCRWIYWYLSIGNRAGLTSSAACNGVWSGFWSNCVTPHNKTLEKSIWGSNVDVQTHWMEKKNVSWMANLCLMRQAEVQPRQNPEKTYKEDTKAEMIHTRSVLTIDRLIGIVPLDLNIKTNKHLRSNCSLWQKTLIWLINLSCISSIYNDPYRETDSRTVDIGHY